MLRLAANESVSNYVLPPLLKAYRLAFPGVKIEVLASPSDGIATLLEDQDVDFGFLSFTPVQHDLVSRLLFRDELALVVFPGHPLARAKSVLLEQLGSEKFVAHLAETPSRRRLVDLFAREGVPLRIVMELSSLETIKDFVKAGDGLAILPRMCLRPGAGGGRAVLAPGEGHGHRPGHPGGLPPGPHPFPRRRGLPGPAGRAASRTWTSPDAQVQEHETA